MLLVSFILSVCHCLFSDYARQYLLKMGGQLDKRMLHWQPATCCIFSCSLLSVIWQIKYYYYYYYYYYYSDASVKIHLSCVVVSWLVTSVDCSKVLCLRAKTTKEHYWENHLHNLSNP